MVGNKNLTDTPLITDLTSRTDGDKVKLSEISGFDSLKFVRLIMEIEDVVGRDLEPDETEKLKDIGSLKSLLNYSDE